MRLLLTGASGQLGSYLLRECRLEMGQRLAVFLGCDAAMIVPVSHGSMIAAEPRPADLSLDSSRWRSLFPHQEWPTWEEALSQLTE